MYTDETFLSNCLMIIALGFFIGGLDELIFDGFYFLHWFQRLRHRKSIQSFEFSSILTCAEKKIAVFAPCWHEEGVINKMIDNAMSTLKYRNFALFIGCYPNDPDTIECAKTAAEKYPNVYLVRGRSFKILSPTEVGASPPIYIVIGDNPGPTCKADNLNQIFEAMERLQSPKDPFEIIVMHDSEDVIHPNSLSVYSFLIGRGKHMVQVPVLPLPVPTSQWVHWTYADEFADQHSRVLPVREYLGGFVPSAGVGTAYSVGCIQWLKRLNGGEAFNTGSLTEDYQSGIELKHQGFQTIFVRMQDANGDLIATRSYFPRSFKAAVRQKTRWTIGIALQGWEKAGFQGGLATRYCLYRDRRILAVAALNLMTYITLMLFFVLRVAPWKLDIMADPLWREIVLTDIALALWRLGIKSGVIWSVYGPKPVPSLLFRSVVADIVNFCASSRAIWQYTRGKILRKKLTWDKTAHEFPDEETVDEMDAESALSGGTLQRVPQMVRTSA